MMRSPRRCASRRLPNCDITCALLHRRLALPIAVWVKRDGGLALCEQRGLISLSSAGPMSGVPGAIIEPSHTGAAIPSPDQAPRITPLARSAAAI
jgi:hypothetical protein